MKGKKFKQINNITITACVDEGLYYAYAPDKKLLFTNANIDIIENSCKNCKTYLKKNKKILTEEELKNKYILVEKAGCWHFPSGKSSLVKAEDYVKKGYVLVYNGTQIGIQGLKQQVAKDLQTPNTLTPYVKYYERIYEYIDNHNKVIYLSFVGLSCDNLM